MAFLQGPKSTIDLGGAEIIGFNNREKIAAVVTGGSSLELVNYSQGFDRPSRLGSIALEGDAQSVAISKQGLIAVAVSKNDNNDGLVVFYRLVNNNPIEQGRLEVGNLPDSLAFSKDGKYLVVANEGEPNTFYGTEDGIDPKGSISVIRVNQKTPGASKVTNLDFAAFTTDELRAAGLRISGENPTPEFDIEPEYTTIAPDGSKAYVTLQENNGIAVVDLKQPRIAAMLSAGYKEWAPAGGEAIAVDTRDDGAFTPGTRNFRGLRMPDGIHAFRAKGKTYLITANEGDGRVRPDDANFEASQPDGTTYSYGTNRVSGFLSDLEDAITGQTIYVYGSAGVGNSGNFSADQGDELFITLKYGAVASDGFYNDEVRARRIGFGDSLIRSEGRLKTIQDQNDPVTGLVGYGGRSFTIYDKRGRVVYDSGNQLEEIAQQLGYYDDSRSDDKGTEPESVITATLGKRSFAFVGLERGANQNGSGAIIPVFEITNPSAPTHVGTFRSELSLSPEGLAWVQHDRRSGHLLVASEVSGSVDAFQFNLGLLA